MTQVNINKMAGKLPNKSEDSLYQCILKSAEKHIEKGIGAFNTGDVSNGGKTTVAAGEKGAFNTGANEKGVISVDSTNGNAPAYNLANASGGEINVRSRVPIGCSCSCEIVVDESDDYISNLKVKCGDFKSGEGIYDMSKPNQRGLCIIFNIVKFPGHETLSDRCGSSYEARCLKKVHTELFCKVDVIHSDEEQNNCKYEDIINKLEETSKLSDNPYQALFVFFLSHGESNGLYCSDGKILEFNEPINMFNNNESTWREIPKFFSFHCCRGSELDYQNTDTSRPTPYAHTLINYSTRFGM